MGVDGWADVRLGDLVQIKHGWPFKSDSLLVRAERPPDCRRNRQLSATPADFVSSPRTPQEYRESIPASSELNPGDILVVATCQTPGGETPGDTRTSFLTTGAVTSPQSAVMGKAVIIRNLILIDDRFLYYVFLWRKLNEELVASSTGTKILHTAPSRIEAFRFSFRPSPVKRRSDHCW